MSAKVICALCGEEIVFDSTSGWHHVGGQPNHVTSPRIVSDFIKSRPIAPEEQAEEGDIYNSGVVLQYRDAPEDELEDEDTILVESGILPKLIEAAIATPPSANWQQELQAIGEPDAPDDVSPALEHHTAAMLNILALKGADPNLLETTGYQMRQLWKMVLRTIGHA